MSLVFLAWLQCNPIQGQYRARTEISLWSFPTQGKTFYHYREPLFSLQGFPCEKNFTGKTLLFNGFAVGKISEWDPHKRHQCASEKPKRPAADCRPCFARHESFSITQWLEYHSALFSSALRPAIFVLLALPKPAIYPVPKFTVPVWLCWFYCNLRAFYSKKKDCIRSALIHLYYVRSVH